jgi:murein DD-endopeptidase MepM/ murein hydrolase activator NlpD
MKATVRIVQLLLVVGLGASCQATSHSRTAPARSGERHDLLLPRDRNVVSARVPANATLETLLRQNRLPDDVTAALVSAARGVFNPRDLRADQPYQVARTLDGLFREFRYRIDADRLLRIVSRKTDGALVPGYDATVVSVPKRTITDSVSAEITHDHSSLVGALGAYGENIQLALMLADIYGGEVDFNSDLQLGDRVDVLFDRVTRDGNVGDGDDDAHVSTYGDIKAAVLHTGGRALTAVRYNDADGKPSWYDEQGRSLKRQFLKSPLPFEPRITSGFSYKRLHPVLGIERAHLGVDYGAPTGTAVMAVASGVVEVADWAGEAGRMIKIRHSGGYETAYLHLSAFGPGIHSGVRVEQGQLIGRVGMTGTATGPHLDYRIAKNGTYVNPTLELSRMPKGEPIDSTSRGAFDTQRDASLTDLQQRMAAAPVPSALAAGAHPSGK